MKSLLKQLDKLMCKHSEWWRQQVIHENALEALSPVDHIESVHNTVEIRLGRIRHKSDSNESGFAESA